MANPPMSHHFVPFFGIPCENLAIRFELGPGMGSADRLAKPLDADVGVDLSRCQALMSQQLLNGFQVGPSIQEVRGE